MAPDLMTQRNIQQFIQLTRLELQQIQSDIYWRTSDFEVWLNYRNKRIHLSQCLITETDDSMLMEALRQWQPTRFYGIPQRFFILNRKLVVNCTPLADSTAEHWFRLYQRQQAFLENLCHPT
ncbi:type III secretion system protein SsaM [unidentified bacterial endosymbiont]|jgi:hypothetical protein|uniref:type III secretion system protein SsaM n=1 Tax=unidentified bacterial endosymbiont TaxID=2355 RepID=UPI00209DF56A|nr:type III secretion system protein SsaM [unidentified bacterial endosymbiont]